MKITLADVASGYNLQSINENFEKISDDLNNRVLYRDNPAGEPNQLQSDIDANSRVIYNLPAPTLQSQAARLRDIINAISPTLSANLIPIDPIAGVLADTVQGALEELLLEFSQGTGNTKSVNSIADLKTVNPSISSTYLVTGYYSRGDGGGGIYSFDFADNSTPDNGGTVIASLASTGRWKLSVTPVLSVKQFGAKGDDATDNSVFLQKALDYSVDNGVTVLIPPGIYRYGTGLVLANANTAAFANRGAFLGESATAVCLMYTGSNAVPALTVLGNTTGSGQTFRTKFGGFRIERFGGTQAGTGILMQNCASMVISDILVHAFNIGLSLLDSLELEFERVITSYCLGGVTAERLTWTNPNLIRWTKCVFLGSPVHGVRATRPANWIFDSCAWGDIGTGTPGYTASSVLLINGPNEGGPAATFINCYLEANRVAQDIYAYSDDQEMSVVFIGNTFQNLNVTTYAKTHIKGESGAAKLTLVMVGTAFKIFGSYVPNALEPCITTLGDKVVVTGHDSIVFGPTVIRPSYSKATDKHGFSVPYARASVAANGTLRANWGLSSVTKTGTGVYRLNYPTALPSAIVCAVVTATGSLGIPTLTAESTSYTEITMKDITGAAADIGFSVEIIGQEV